MFEYPSSYVCGEDAAALEMGLTHFRAAEAKAMQKQALVRQARNALPKSNGRSTLSVLWEHLHILGTWLKRPAREAQQ